MANTKNIFTRVQSPNPEFSGIFNDIYDKLAQLTPVAPSPTPSPTPTPTPTPTPPSPSPSPGPAPSSYAYTNIPELPALPSNNPSIGAPYAVDGVVVEVNKQLWRYVGSPTYQWQLAGTATQIITDTHSNRVLNFPATSYPNGYFLESDTLVLLESNSTTWRTIAGLITDTHANRLSLWPSIQYSVGTPFYETDRTVTYWVQNAAGTVTVAGGVNVTWVSGNHFINTGTGFNANQWPAGTKIVINGVDCFVATVNSPTSITLGVATTNAVGVSYSVASGRWVYVDGEFSSLLANAPTDLGENDASFKFSASDYLHVWKFSGTAFVFAPGDPGSGFVSEGKPDGSAPNGGLWGLCDGSSYAVAKADATGTTSVATVDRTNDSFPQGSTTFGAKAASRAKWEATAVTDDESAHTHSVDPPNTTSGNDSGAGTVVQSGAGTTVATHTHTHDVDIAPFNSGSGTAHHHVLSDANAQLKVFSETNGGLPARVGVGYYIRR